MSGECIGIHGITAYDMPDECINNGGAYSQYFASSQTKTASIEASSCFPVMV